MICRYGFTGGLFTTIKGTDYDALGLPFVKETIDYHEHKVTEDSSDECRAVKGIAAPKYSSNG
ncbi:MAG: TNT domain-containing protein, partial [Lachnospiraceae bacterium]|nr:TNT domain-containing protein [Lachnospiraceae bacterium]